MYLLYPILSVLERRLLFDIKFSSEVQSLIIDILHSNFLLENKISKKLLTRLSTHNVLTSKFHSNIKLTAHY